MSRTAYLHGRKHTVGQAKQAEDNALAKHDSVHHDGTPQTYSMKVMRAHKQPLSHQIWGHTDPVLNCWHQIEQQGGV